MSILRQLLKKPFANYTGYELLRHQVKFCHWLMGAGAGGDVDESGERTVLRKVFGKQPEHPLTVFDVGANKGQFLSYLLRDFAEQLASVHSFEPGKESFEHLLRVDCGEVTVLRNRCALGRQSGEATLFYDAAGSELASLSQRDLSFKNRSFDESETVKVLTLEDYCTASSITAIDWLKLDVEGHELDVLQGGRALIDTGAIRLITFEFGGANIDSRTYLRDFYNFFKDTPLQLHRITPGGYLHPIKRYRETEEIFTTTNYAAFQATAR